jgi:putative ABC transport system permease protein
VVFSILQDLKFAARSFRRTPALTAVVVITLALGIGANAAVLPFLYGILLRPLPFEQPERLAFLFENGPGFTQASPSFPNFVDWRERSTSFEDMGACWGTRRTITGRGDPEQLSGRLVSHSLFGMLGVRPISGRAFLPEDDVPGAAATVLLSHGLWARRFGSDPALVGQSILLDGEPHTVVGIMPAGFRFPDQAEFWVPYRSSPTAGRRGGAARVIGRLQKDVTFERAQSEMSAIAAQLGQEYPATNAQRGVVVRPLAEDILWGHRRPVLIFYAVACIVLLLACANVTNLLLARSAERRREIAMRSVLGASRSRIAGQLFTESLLVASLGGPLGILIGVWGRNAALAAMPEPFPYYFRFDIGLPVLLAIVGTTVLSGFVFSLAPILGSGSYALSEGLRDGDAQQGSGRTTNRVRSALVVCEIGLALVVLVGAGLLTRSFLVLTAVEPGFEPENLISVQLSLPRASYREESQQAELFREARERIGSVAGVVGVSGVSNLPMAGSSQRTSIYAEDTPVPAQGEEDFSLNRQVQTGYFDVMGIPLLSGRNFDEYGVGPPVVIVDQALASHLWPDENPLGKRIKYGASDDTRWPWMEVIGVVGNTHQFSLDDGAEKGMYRPFIQEPMRQQTLVIRTAGEPGLLADQIRREIWAIDPNLPLDNVWTMKRLVRDSYWERTAQMWLLCVLSTIAILLAAFGVYGVVAHSVSQRTREFGIRMALGADRLEVARLVVRQVGLLATIGLACGVAVALVVMRFGSALLYGVGYTDTATYGFAVMGMAAIVVIAGYVPARRAARLDPAVALRGE